MKTQENLISKTMVEIPDSNAELEARIKVLEDNIILDQQMYLTLSQKHNELIDLLHKKGLV
jgi:hypothetical protein